MGDATGQPTERAARWRQFVGPLIQEIWPLDVALRSDAISRNLLLMTLECGEAFPEAVDAVVDLVVPFQLYSIAHTFRLEPAHDDTVRQHPRSALRLANAVINPAVAPVPSDLAEFLKKHVWTPIRALCQRRPIFASGLRRQRAA